MKKNRMVCLLLALMMLLYACGSRKSAEGTRPTEGKYQDLIKKLDAGDYDGARALIDEMEGIPSGESAPQTQPTETEGVEQPPQVQPQTAPPSEGTVIQLTAENAWEYFEVTVNFFNGDEKSFHQAIALKPEYRSRVVRLEDVALEVTYLLSNAYGSVDDRNGEFSAERFEVISDEMTMEVTIDNSNTGYLSNGTYVTKKGYFPNFAIETQIVSGSGRLILTDE